MASMPLLTSPALTRLKANVVAAKPPRPSGAGSAIKLIAETAGMSCSFVRSTLSAAVGAALSRHTISAMPLPPQYRLLATMLRCCHPPPRRGAYIGVLDGATFVPWEPHVRRRCAVLQRAGLTPPSPPLRRPSGQELRR